VVLGWGRRVRRPPSPNWRFGVADIRHTADVPIVLTDDPSDVSQPHPPDQELSG
jgi:hypothetical protein